MYQYFVYIIYSYKLNKYYIGYTSDIEERIIEHNTGFSTFTSKADDWVLKYNECYNSREGAAKREREIKAKKSRKYVEFLIGVN